MQPKGQRLGGRRLLVNAARPRLQAVAMNSKGRVPGVLLIPCTIAGAILGGTMVAVCTTLAVVGGIPAVAGSPQSSGAVH